MSNIKRSPFVSVLSLFIFFASLASLSVLAEQEGATLVDREEVQQQESAVAAEAEQIQEDFLKEAELAHEALQEKPVENIKDIFAPKQIQILEEVGSLYELGLEYIETLLAGFRRNQAPRELENIARFAEEIERNPGLKEKYAAREGDRALVKLLHDVEIYKSGDRQRLLNEIAVTHLLDRINKAELPKFSNELGYYKVTQIDGVPIVRVVHRESRTSFLMLPSDKISRTSSHLRQYTGRQLFDSKVPTVARPDGDQQKIGLKGTVQIWLDENNEVRDLQAHSKPRLLTKSWWKYNRDATVVKPDAEAVIFGGICGGLQVGLQACVGSSNGIAPSAVSMVYGGGIGMNHPTYRNWLNRGYDLRPQLMKGALISYSFSYLFYFASHGFEVFDPDNALGFFNTMTHLHIVLNGLIMVPARSAWNLWGQVRDRLRIGLELLTVRVGNLQYRAKSLKKNALFNQLFLANIPWLAKIYDLKHPELKWFLTDDVYISQGKLWMMASIVAAVLVTGTEIALREKSERFKNSATMDSVKQFFRKNIHMLERSILKIAIIGHVLPLAARGMRKVGLGRFVPKVPSDRGIVITVMDALAEGMSRMFTRIKGRGQKSDVDEALHIGDRELSDIEMHEVEEAFVEEGIHGPQVFARHPKCEDFLELRKRAS